MELNMADVEIKVAKLETNVDNIVKDIDDLRSDIKQVHTKIDSGNEKIMDKLASMSKDADDQHNGIVERMNDMDKRINGRIGVLEKWKWMVLGGAVIVAWIISFVPQLIQNM